VDFKLELVLIPVGDVDRAKAFYVETLQWGLNVDHSPNESFRIVQVDPPGSACSIGFGVTAPAGSTRGLHLMVTDIVAARDELVAKGVDANPVRHVGMDGVWHDGPHPDRGDYQSFSEFSDPDGNVWLLQERGFAG
jgi:catechol 2,3-dioxygenase-like lactoylglutathione lyase family enzyme